MHNDSYRGKGNATYQASNMRSNQGFASVIATFPQGSFATCRYPDSSEKQRKPYENTWSAALTAHTHSCCHCTALSQALR